MKARWRKFYEKAEDGLRLQYASRYVPSDGINPRYKVVDYDLNKSWIVSEQRIAYGILKETLNRGHETQLMEV